MNDVPLLDWSKRLAAIAQTGITYAQSPFDIQRYEEVRQIAAEMLAAVSVHSPRALVKLFSEDRGYATPKVDVRGMVFREGKILLVREKEDGLWTPPGGWVDVGDNPTEAVEREVREESGYVASARKLIAVHNRDRHGHTPLPFAVYKLMFLCDLGGGEATISDETTEVSFFPRHALPPLSIARIVPEQIALAYAHLEDPSLPTEFD